MQCFGKSSGGGRRLAPRETAPVMATIFTLFRSSSAVVVDVSASGARLRGERLPDEAEEVIVCIDGLRTYGSVAWAIGDECGIKFGEELPADWLEGLRARVARVRGLPPELKAAYDDWMVGVAR
jgi:hypothetical protein